MFRNPVGAHRNAGVPLSGKTWRDRQIDGDDLAGVLFHDCTFERVRMKRVNLRQTSFVDSRFVDCVFDDCELVETLWISCSGTGFQIERGRASQLLVSGCKLSRLGFTQSGQQVTLAESSIDHLVFDGPGCHQNSLTISGCTFSEFVVENAVWQGGTLVGLNMDVCSLDGARFERCSFIQSTGEGIDLSKVRFESCNLYQSVLPKGRFSWAERSIFAECDLTEADFSQAALSGALFAKATAPRSRFDRAVLDGAMFPKAILTGASFTDATAKQSVWLDADLTDADLQGMDAWRSTFRNATLKGAEVTNARFLEADLHGVAETLDGADLRGARATEAWRAEYEAKMRAGKDTR